MRRIGAAQQTSAEQMGRPYMGSGSTISKRCADGSGRPLLLASEPNSGVVDQNVAPRILSVSIAPMSGRP